MPTGRRFVQFGSFVYANFNLTLVDDTHIYVGTTHDRANVVIAPGPSLLPVLRSGDAVQHACPHWPQLLAGAGVIVLPGVSIGTTR